MGLKRVSIRDKIAHLESALNHFDPGVRAEALEGLLALVRTGVLSLPAPAEVANMHCHTFFSFNAFGYSPTGLAWLAKRRGIKLMGIVDFDVLDGVEEFLTACRKLGVRGSAGIETRVYIPEFAAHEINSPGEPGIYYDMGIGFYSAAVPDSAKAALDTLRARAATRNTTIIERVNRHLAPVSIDYEQDVLPLTPAGNVTERHIVLGYLYAAERIIPSAERAAFWADKLDMARDQVDRMALDSAALQNTIRIRLMKRGGVGYVQPETATFPRVDEFHEFIAACGALPCATWLDGTSSGEQRIVPLLELLISKGTVALNIIPDRNWNIADAQQQRIKLDNLYAVVKHAKALDLPLNVGTEMNSFGQKLVDDFAAPELDPVREAFLDGAYFIYGHTIAAREAGIGYSSPWAAAHLPSRRERNDFYIRLGRAVEPNDEGLSVLRHVVPGMTPAQILARIGNGSRA